MANLKKTLVITAIVGVLTFGVWKGLEVAKVSNAADKLDYDIDAFTLKEIKKNPIGVPTSLIYTVTLKLNNPTDQDLIITKPYFIISLKKSDGTLAKIFNTNTPDTTETNIKAKSSTVLKHDVELRVVNVLPVLPNFIGYLISKATGGKATQTIIVDATIDSMGLTLPIQKIVKI